MKKLNRTITCIAFLLFMIAGRVHAQVSITAVPPGPRFTVDDLWNLTMVKTNALSSDIYLNLVMNVYDKKGSKILMATTNKFQFIRNVLTVNKTNMNKYQPVTLQYYQRKFQNNAGKQGGLFPAGDYKVEFILNAVGTSAGGATFTEPLGRTSYNINAMLTYPIQLVSVYNNDTIKDANPNFTWIPPYPLPEGNVTYKITISEIYPEQTPVVAVKENVPLSKKDVINNNTFFYSASNPQLQKGKEYAWSVNAYGRGGELVSGSETWRFIYTEEDTIWYEPEQYYVMERELGFSYVPIDSNILPIKFQEDYRVLDSLSNIILYNTAFDTVATYEDIALGYEQGLNYTFVSFCEEDFPFPLENEIYILEIELLNHDKYYIRFKNNSTVGVCAY